MSRRIQTIARGAISSILSSGGESPDSRYDTEERVVENTGRIELAEVRVTFSDFSIRLSTPFKIACRVGIGDTPRSVLPREERATAVLRALDACVMAWCLE